MLGILTFSITTAKADFQQIYTIAQDVLKLTSDMEQLKVAPLNAKLPLVDIIIADLKALKIDTEGVVGGAKAAFQYYPAAAQTFFTTLVTNFNDPAQQAKFIAELKDNANNADALADVLTLGGIPPDRAAQQVQSIQNFIDANVKLKKTIDRLSDQLATQYNTTITKVVDLISTKAKQHPIATEILKTVIKRVQEDSASQHPFVKQLVQTYVSDPNGIIIDLLHNLEMVEEFLEKTKSSTAAYPCM